MIIETKYKTLLTAITKKRDLEKKKRKQGYLDSTDRQRLADLNYQLDRVIKQEKIEKDYLEKINA